MNTQQNDTAIVSSSRTKLSLRALMSVTAAVGMACALYLWACRFYYAERRETRSVLREIKGIDFEISTFTDVVEEVSEVTITVDGYADSHISLSGLGAYRSNGIFEVSRVGKWRFAISGRRYGGAYNSDTGEPVESHYIGSHIVFGPSSPYNKLIPFRVHTLQDLVDHYQDLVGVFGTWPREHEPGRVTLEDGSTQYYYVVEDEY